MPKTTVEINSDNEDALSAAIFWYDKTDGVFIEQFERGLDGKPPHRGLLLFGHEAIPAIIAALQQYIEPSP